MKDIKLNIIKVLSVLFAITLVALLASIAKSHQLQSNLDRQTSNVGALTYDIKYDKLDDSLPVAKNAALQAKVSELEQLHLTDTKLIKELKVKLKDVQSQHTLSAETADTVIIAPVPGTADSVFTYKDKWLSLHIDIPKRECQYVAYDSLTTIVSRTYKHRFLWWRWGIKGYDVRIVSFNPHSRIKYSRYIEVEK